MAGKRLMVRPCSWMAVVLIGFLLMPTSMGFIPNSNSVRQEDATAIYQTNFWDDMMQRFGRNSNDGNDDTDDDAMPKVRVVTLPVRRIKPGGLRLFLMFYLMGMQNTPDPQTWLAHQPDDTKEEHVIDCFFRDRSGLLSIQLKEREIVVDRIGSSPSNAYIMQESVLLEGLLDELGQIEAAPDVAVEDRLLQLHRDDAIDRVKEELSFG